MAFRNGSSDTESSNSRVVPAQVNFLTIYNPTLGDTEEIEKDQIVFWVGKSELETARSARKVSKSPKRNDKSKDTTGIFSAMSEEHELNDRLRQIGLARGMVQFARNFSNSAPLDTIETDRCRIVMYELEKDWWILASIDLTRLPAVQSKGDGASSKESQSDVEFSAREVSPAALLRAQLIKAHNLFLLHHAANLWELYHRSGRSTFCAHLNRFWEGFAQRWDVLLHGNPAVDIYGDCVKLAGGGELGVGVGEEEWGSGEREVLEGFVERTEGLVECVVGRYGSAPSEKTKKRLNAVKKGQTSSDEKIQLSMTSDIRPWLGAGEDPGPGDGVIFTGMGTVSRKSLATVSQWMEAIFKHGDAAYGIGDSPSRARQTKRRPKTERKVSDDVPKSTKDGGGAGVEGHSRSRNSKNKAPDLRRQAMQNNAVPPGIPAPLVGAVERSLDEAVAKAAERTSSKSPKSSPRSSPKSSPRHEKTEDEAMTSSSDSKDEASSIFSMEGMKSIFSLGYGSNWTLNPSGFEKKEEQEAPKTPTSKGSRNNQKSNSNGRPESLSKSYASGRTDSSTDSASNQSPPSPGGKQTEQSPQQDVQPQDRPPLQRSVSGSKPAQDRLQEIDPTPEVSDEDLPFVQRLEKSIGKFLVGLSGDLENMEFEDTDDPSEFSDANRKSRSTRIVFRTLTVELANTHYSRPGLRREDRKASQTSNISKTSLESAGSARSKQGPEPKTSAAASVDGARPTRRCEKVQIAIYVHQPFIFVFLFELHNPKLTMPAFYRTIHHSLGPLQKPLLRSTDLTRVAERIAGTLNEKASAAVTAVRKHVDNNGNAIYDLVYDSTKNTIRTSLPNIPVPTSPNSVVKTTSTISGSWYTLGIPIGRSSSPSASRLDPVSDTSKVEPWSRIEALNVHTQVLNTFMATRHPNELERTVKTARGWWVLWMKISAPGKEVEELKEAFLVRKSADFTTSRQARDGGRSSGSSSGRWLLRDQTRDASGSSNFSGSVGPGTGAKSVSEGVGIDAKKWVEGLLSLTQ